MKLARFRCSIVILLFCISLPPTRGDSWSESFQKQIEAIPAEPSAEELLMLARLSSNDPSIPERVAVKHQAWDRLRSVPDFANRLAGHIKTEKERWLSGEELSSARYDRQRDWTLSPMGKLPDPSIVRVLGEFLPDTEWPGYDSPIKAAMDGCPPPNALLAARALGQLIEKPPLQKNPDEYSLDDVTTWELWYAQVKAGTRTYRFKGDPQEYDLHGPVSKIVTSTETLPGSSTTDADLGDQSTARKRSFPVIAFLAACGVLGLAMWRLFVGRKTMGT